MHGSVPFTKEIISQLKRCKVVCRTGVGVDRMDLAAAEEYGITVCNAAGCNSIEVSEQAIGLLIAISRKLMRMNQYVRDGKCGGTLPSCTPIAAGYIEFRDERWASSAWATSANRSPRALRGCG